GRLMAIGSGGSKVEGAFPVDGDRWWTVENLTEWMRRRNGRDLNPPPFGS
ncbi:hypothetical protein A2U01_0075694, partial [Trifolium medium]|nr:hypothetical protein [Trifolium medium]